MRCRRQTGVPIASDELVDEQQRRLDVPARGLTAQRVVEIAAARLAPLAGRVTVDAGAHMFPATMLWPVDEPNGMLISNGLSTMGFALPAAIGAALARSGTAGGRADRRRRPADVRRASS